MSDATSDAVLVTVKPNGPLILTGRFEVRRTNGELLSTETRVVLCRCGQSAAKPFCDGTHKRGGFVAE